MSIFFESMPYRLDESTGLIDYDGCEAWRAPTAPRCSSPARRRIRVCTITNGCAPIADSTGAYLLADMAHISGLVAAKMIASPFDHADVVTTTTHKSLRGPRGAMIFYRKGQKGTNKKGDPIMYDLEDKINFSVFPGLQGGPHNQTIAGLAVALKQACSPEFAEYQQQVMRTMVAMSDRLKKHGIELVSGGTDNHLVLADLRPLGVDGSRVERVLELAHIACNKNTVPGDKSAGPRRFAAGHAALTTRGFVEADFERAADFVVKGIGIAKALKETHGPKLKDFREALADAPAGKFPEIDALRDQVEAFAAQFPTIGFDKAEGKYTQSL